MIKYDQRKYMMSLSMDENTWDTKSQYKSIPINTILELSGEISRDMFFSIKNRNGDILESKIKNPKEFIEIGEGEFACVETLKSNIFAHRQITDERSTIINAFKIESWEHTNDNLVWLLHTLGSDIIYNCETRKIVEGKFNSLSESETQLTIVSKRNIDWATDTWVITLAKDSLNPISIYSNLLKQFFTCENQELKTLQELEATILQRISEHLKESSPLNQAHLSRNKI